MALDFDDYDDDEYDGGVPCSNCNCNADDHEEELGGYGACMLCGCQQFESGDEDQEDLDAGVDDDGIGLDDFDDEDDDE